MPQAFSWFLPCEGINSLWRYPVHGLWKAVKLFLFTITFEEFFCWLRLGLCPWHLVYLSQSIFIALVEAASYHLLHTFSSVSCLTPSFPSVSTSPCRPADNVAPKWLCISWCGCFFFLLYSVYVILRITYNVRGVERGAWKLCDTYGQSVTVTMMEKSSESVERRWGRGWGGNKTPGRETGRKKT